MSITDQQVQKPRRLGRGLSSLIGEPVVVSEHKLTESAAGSLPSGLKMVDVGLIVPSPFQPRREIAPAALAGLAASIKHSGLMQPIVVRAVGGKFELVAGERRWRAAMAAGLDRVPAVVRELSDEESGEWALVENLQREDLNPVERGAALKHLMSRFGLTQGDLADRVGLERSSLANLVRLMDLEESVLALISAGLLSGGHGKALLGFAPGEERERLAARAAREEWSVRRLEQEVRGDGEMSTRERPAPAANPGRAELERQLSEHLGTKVLLKTDGSGKRGRMLVEFYDLEHFDGLMKRIGFAAK